MAEHPPISGRIVRLIDDHTAVLNVGRTVGVEPGMRFAIYTPTDVIVDPETEEELGRYRRRKGIVVVEELGDRFCIAGAPSVKEVVVDEVGMFGLGRMRKTTVIKRELNVDPGHVTPMPTGDEVLVGDVVEQVSRS